MAKRKPEDPPAGSPAWMSTFSDLMNLLLCFFVMLFSMSSIDANKWDEMAAAMSNSAFSIFNAGSTAMRKIFKAMKNCPKWYRKL